jgi:recombination protein RecA
MSDRSKELEKRVKSLRSSKDRTALLEARIQEHRSGRHSQRERQARQAKEFVSDRDKLFWDFTEETPNAALRWDEIGALGLLVEKKVTPAIAFSTGVLSLDSALGGGIPAGFTEIYGEESVGKTTTLIQLICSAQEKNMRVALCPSEFLDLPYMESLGVDLKRLVIVRGAGEGVLEEAARFVHQEKAGVVFIDSITGVRPEVDEYANWRWMVGSWMMAIHSKIPIDSAIVLTNQVRARRSAVPSKLFAGGTDSAAKRIAGLFDCRLSLSRDAVTDYEYDMVIDIVSNTLRSPSRIFTVPVRKGKGIDVWRDLVRVAAQLGVIEQRGSWYYYETATIGQGEEVVARHLEVKASFGQIIMEDTLRALRG